MKELMHMRSVWYIFGEVRHTFLRFPMATALAVAACFVSWHLIAGTAG